MQSVVKCLRFDVSRVTCVAAHVAANILSLVVQMKPNMISPQPHRNKQIIPIFLTITILGTHDACNRNSVYSMQIFVVNEIIFIRPFGINSYFVCFHSLSEISFLHDEFTLCGAPGPIFDSKSMLTFAFAANNNNNCGCFQLFPKWKVTHPI